MFLHLSRNAFELEQINPDLREKNFPPKTIGKILQLQQAVFKDIIEEDLLVPRNLRFKRVYASLILAY